MLLAVLPLIGLSGVNLSFLYKEAVRSLLDDLWEGARAIGAVNTVVVKAPDDRHAGRTRAGRASPPCTSSADWRRGRGVEEARGSRDRARHHHRPGHLDLARREHQ
jgi:hypothetical protein